MITSAAGTSSSTAPITKSLTWTWPSRFWNHQASISGVAIFRISLGWITSGPIASQRVAPLRVTPKIAVATSSASPTVYSGTAMRCNFCGGTWATTNSTASASTMLRPWSTKRVPWS